MLIIFSGLQNLTIGVLLSVVLSLSGFSICSLLTHLHNELDNAGHFLGVKLVIFRTAGVDMLLIGVDSDSTTISNSYFLFLKVQARKSLGS